MSSETAEISRREQRRQETLTDITATARMLLVRDGAVGVTLRAIARELGMTAPALYRYFDSHEAVVTALAADLYDELVETMGEARDAIPGASVGTRLIAVTRAFRSWSLAHKPEFGLVFANPITDIAGPAADVCEEAGHRFGKVFGDLFNELWATRPFAVPAVEDLAPELVGQLAERIEDVSGPLPPGAIYVFLRCWTRVYGTVTLEVFGHLGWALTDTAPIFEDMLVDNAHALGVIEDYEQTRR